MKIEFIENKWGVDFIMTPESPAECAQVLRFANNAAAKKPSIYFTFSTDTPLCYVSLEKRKEIAQKNSISPNTNSK